jgi:hypothetical protein
MPVEIRELIIKTTVVQGTQSGTTQGSTTSTNEQSPAEEIINEALEKMIQIQRDKKER